MTSKTHGDNTCVKLRCVASLDNNKLNKLIIRKRILKYNELQ